MEASDFLPKIPVWIYRLLAAFPATGFLGVDHFAIGSKETGMAKGLVNLLTFGSWYWFDIVQSFDTEKVAREGLSIPFYGSAGIGQGKLGEGLLGSNDPSVKFWINILVIFAGFSIAGLSGLYITKPNPVGGAAKAIGGVAGAIAISLMGMTIASSFKSVVPSNLSVISSLVLPQIGGAQETKETKGVSFVEILTLGTLAALTITGFALHSVRNST